MWPSPPRVESHRNPHSLLWRWKPSSTSRIDTRSRRGRGTVASGQGVREILIGLLLTVIGFGSILVRAPVICCGFAIAGPILFIVGLVKAIQAPPAAPMVYPSTYPLPPYVPPPPPAPGHEAVLRLPVDRRPEPHEDLDVLVVRDGGEAQQDRRGRDPRGRARRAVFPEDRRDRLRF